MREVRRNKQKILFTLLMLFLLFLVTKWTSKSVIASISQTATSEAFVNDLKNNRAKWENKKIAHYRMVLNLPYSSGQYTRLPLTIEVKDGYPVLINDVNGKTVQSTDEDFAGEFFSGSEEFTIEGLFSIAEKTFLDNPPEITVTYDPEYGYPATIYVNPYKEPCCQEYSYDILSFEILSP